MAFAADRMFFLPAGAAAAAAPEAETGTSPVAVSKEAVHTEALEPTLAERLRIVSVAYEMDTGADPFKAKWHAAAKAKEVKSPQGQSPADYFASTHRLTGVSKPNENTSGGGDDARWAQITSKVGDKSRTKTCKIGDTIDGWTLVSVTIEGDEMSASLEGPAGTVTLRLGKASKGQ